MLKFSDSTNIIKEGCSDIAFEPLNTILYNNNYELYDDIYLTNDKDELVFLSFFIIKKL